MQLETATRVVKSIRAEMLVLEIVQLQIKKRDRGTTQLPWFAMMRQKPRHMRHCSLLIRLVSTYLKSGNSSVLAFV